MRRLLIVALLAMLIAARAEALSPLVVYDGGELMSSAQIGSTSGASACFPFADGDAGVDSGHAWTGLSSFKLAAPGSGDNLSVFQIDTCASPDFTLFNPCPSVNRLSGAQEVGMAMSFTAAPSADSPFLTIGNRVCQDAPISTCSRSTWDRGNRMIYFDWTTDQKVKVEAFKLGAAIPTPTPPPTAIGVSPTPTGNHSRCKSADALPLLGATQPFSWVSFVVKENYPSAGQLTVLGYTERYDTPTVDATIDCAFDYSGDSFPSARMHVLWDKTQATSATGLPALFDDVAWAQSTNAQADFLKPLICYPAISSSSSASGAFTSEVDAEFSQAGTGTRVDAVSQNPFNTNKYLVSPATCDDSGCNETFVPTTSSFTPNTSGVPQSAVSYPVAQFGGLVGPLMYTAPVFFLNGPSGGSDAGTLIEVVDGSVRCSAGKAITSLTTTQRMSAPIRRPDGVNDTIGSTTACDTGSGRDFHCGESGQVTCAGGVADYAHSIRPGVTRLGGTNSSTTQLVDGYLSSCYAKGTVVPDTPTATITRTFTATPTITRTPTITNTPAQTYTFTRTLTPTITRTPTRTPTSASTFTPSPTLGTPLPDTTDPWGDLCHTSKCTFCAHTQNDPRIALAQAKAATSGCPQGVTFVIDRDYTQTSAPTLITDAGQKLGGLALFSKLTIKAPKGIKIVSNGAGALLHCDTNAPCSDVHIEGGEWDATAIAANQSAFNLFGISNLTVDGATIRLADQTGITYGGASAKDVTLSNITTTCTGDCIPRRDAGVTGLLLSGNVDVVLTPTPTP